MVNLVEDWVTFEDIANDRRGRYQFIDAGKKQEVRVSVGDLGFKREYEAENPELSKIKEFVERKRFIKQFIKVSGNIPDEFFFK